ncbi:MAG: DnaJ domain-containing protein [Acidobacteriota bacterium]|nr:MAG: DnaJ domain-containing protein [Acidobacteriota bacterium]
MTKNYYTILAVPLDADPAAICSAFRELAKKYHPDHAGVAGAERFREVSEAYDVLSNPLRRARYDRRLKRGQLRTSTLATEPTGAPGLVEPLVAEPISIPGAPETIRPSYESLLERLMRNFTGVDVPKAERAEPLHFELILSPEEVERGILVPFVLPVLRVCGVCGGSGRNWAYPCAACDARGGWTDQVTLRVRLPAHVLSGTVVDVPLNELGIENLWIRIHVRVASY